ncbi:MAG: transcription antitermination factor NusB [Pseudomonadota bacterium]|nr:transcription antitermination factor NusB [Pseudomonadota bacterium]
MLDSREISSKVLSDIYYGKTFDRALSLNDEYSKLDQRDKSLVSLLVLTSLRRNGQIDAVLSKFIKKPLKKNFFITYLLKISVAQILYLEFPEYSVVHNAVEISKKYKSEKFTNAILRNVCKNKNKFLKEISSIINIPKWIKNDLESFRGKNDLLELSNQIFKEPCIDIIIKKKNFENYNWEKLLCGEKIFENIIRIKNISNIESLPFYNEGKWWVQGLSSSLPVYLINKIFKQSMKQNNSVLDVGAAPGGKSFQLIDLGFKVKSLEISRNRIITFKNNLKRLKLDADVINEDFLDTNLKEKFDFILIDAPCSGSGLMQKKPEMLVVEKDVSNLVKKQKRMLLKASNLVKNGGYIIYCVCSLLNKEGEDQVISFLENNKNFSAVNFFTDILEFGKVLKSGTFLATPNSFVRKGGVDGFFIACLIKNVS